MNFDPLYPAVEILHNISSTWDVFTSPQALQLLEPLLFPDRFHYAMLYAHFLKVPGSAGRPRVCEKSKCEGKQTQSDRLLSVAARRRLRRAKPGFAGRSTDGWQRLGRKDAPNGVSRRSPPIRPRYLRIAGQDFEFHAPCSALYVRTNIYPPLRLPSPAPFRQLLYGTFWRRRDGTNISSRL